MPKFKIGDQIFICSSTYRKMWEKTPSIFEGKIGIVTEVSSSHLIAHFENGFWTFSLGYGYVVLAENPDIKE